MKVPTILVNSEEVDAFAHEYCIVQGVAITSVIGDDGINTAYFVEGREDIRLELVWKEVDSSMNLSQNEAIALMIDGCTLSHSSFTESETMSMNMMGDIVFEDGVVVPIDEFFKYRNGKIWEANYKFISVREDEYA